MKPLLLIYPLTLLLLAGCNTTSYQSFEGDGKAIRGQGGTKEVISGVDVWNFGTPPFDYVIIGVIDDERPGGRLYMKSLYADAAAKAKEVGADGVIVESNNNKVTGSYSSGSTGYVVGNNVYTGASTSYAIKRNFARFLVIKYIK